MKKGRLVLITIVALFCSGCSANYNLNIDSLDKINEVLELNASDENDKLEISNYNTFLPVDRNADDITVFKNKIAGVEYYNQKISASGDKLIFQYSHHKFKSFYNDYITNNSYEYVTIMNHDDNLVLSTSKVNYAFEKYENLDNLTIKIISKYKLKETNADIIGDREYIWNISREDANKRYIYLSLDTSEKNLKFWEKFLDGQYTDIFTVLVFLVVLGGIGYIFIRRRGKKVDSI